MRIRRYRSEDGCIGYRAGDLLHDQTTDAWSIAVADGRGVSLVPVRVRRRTGATCVGDWRLAPLDVGFDPRVHDMAVLAPEDMRSVGIEHEGSVYEVEGPRDALIAVARAAGYRVIDRAEDA